MGDMKIIGCVISDGIHTSRIWLMFRDMGVGRGHLLFVVPTVWCIVRVRKQPWQLVSTAAVYHGAFILVICAPVTPGSFLTARIGDVAHYWDIVVDYLSNKN